MFVHMPKHLNIIHHQVSAFVYSSWNSAVRNTGDTCRELQGMEEKA